MKNKTIQAFIPNLKSSFAFALLAIASMVMLPAATVPDQGTTTRGITNATPAQPATSATETAKADDDSAADSKEHKHSASFEINTDDDTTVGAVIIPIVAIVATFGTPVLIVFFVCYFKYRRRQENLALVREFLNKGLPVPPELLDPSLNAGDAAAIVSSKLRPKSDLRKGFNLAFIGLGLTLAFYIDDPHSTTWGWGLIPMIMGIGYLVSGWVENRQNKPDENSRNTPPPGTPL